MMQNIYNICNINIYVTSKYTYIFFLFSYPHFSNMHLFLFAALYVTTSMSSTFTYIYVSLVTFRPKNTIGSWHWLVITHLPMIFKHWMWPAHLPSATLGLLHLPVPAPALPLEVSFQIGEQWFTIQGCVNR